MKKLVFLVFVSLWFAGYGQLAQSFENFKNSSALQGATIGVSVLEVNSGNPIFEYNATQFFYPASIQKIITTACALQLLGSNFSYETKVYYTGNIANGKLNGNLVIEPSGDPTTNSKHFSNDLLEEVLSQLKAKGITSIAGEVLILGQPGQHNTPLTWLFEDIGNYYGVASKLFNYKQNMYTISFLQKADGLIPSIQEIDLPVSYKFDLKLTCSSAQKGDHSFILGAPFSLEREVVGTISAGTSIFKVKGANSNPEYSFVKELEMVLTVEHTKLAGIDKTLLFTQKSSALYSIAKVTNHQSVNLFAEGILNTLGLSFQNDYQTAAGIELIENYLKQSSADEKQVIIKDGSGLSRLNAMTPNFAANWMCDFYENKDFVNSLPVSGESGTMQYLNQVGLKGKVRAKTGSAEGVVNYAGYLTKDNGQVFAFSIFVNNAYQSRYSVRKEIGVFLESILVN